jgi:hypothetical protein
VIVGIIINVLTVVSALTFFLVKILPLIITEFKKNG